MIKKIDKNEERLRRHARVRRKIRYRGDPQNERFPQS